MIRLTHVNKSFADGKTHRVDSLKDITLHIRPKELVLLKGPSGSGKSTLLAIIAALGKPTSGEVIVDGKSIAKLPDRFATTFRREHIGMIFQKFNLIGEMSALDNVTLPLLPTDQSIDEIRERAYKILKHLGVKKRLGTLAKNLSGGEQQRVAIARALIADPKIILADEPTANLDRKLTLDFIEIIKQLKKEGRTILIATHDPIFFDLGIVDRIIEIEEGAVR
jgi:putative ABC transport system ATP-binding protein